MPAYPRASSHLAELVGRQGEHRGHGYNRSEIAAVTRGRVSRGRAKDEHHHQSDRAEELLADPAVAGEYRSSLAATPPTGPPGATGHEAQVAGRARRAWTNTLGVNRPGSGEAGEAPPPRPQPDDDPEAAVDQPQSAFGLTTRHVAAAGQSTRRKPGELGARGRVLPVRSMVSMVSICCAPSATATPVEQPGRRRLRPDERRARRRTSWSPPLPTPRTGRCHGDRQHHHDQGPSAPRPLAAPPRVNAVTSAPGPPGRLRQARRPSRRPAAGTGRTSSGRGSRRARR